MSSNNQLYTHNINSETAGVNIPVNELKNASSQITEGYVFVWLNYAKHFGCVKNGEMNFYDASFSFEKEAAFVVCLRIFNEAEELLLKKQGNSFMGRYRKDHEDKPPNVSSVDAGLLLWGDYAETLNASYSRLWSKRGTEIILPGSYVITEGEPDKKIVLTTRNYISSTGIASYEDARFVKIEMKSL